MAGYFMLTNRLGSIAQGQSPNRRTLKSWAHSTSHLESRRCSAWLHQQLYFQQNGRTCLRSRGVPFRRFFGAKETREQSIRWISLEKLCHIGHTQVGFKTNKKVNMVDAHLKLIYHKAMFSSDFTKNPLTCEFQFQVSEDRLPILWTENYVVT